MAEDNFPESHFDDQVADNVTLLEPNVAQKARDIAQYGVIAVKKEESVYKAIGIMAEKHISGLPVIDESGLVGIISEKDVLKLLYDTEFLPGTVEDYMTKNVVSFDIEDDISIICVCLINNNFRRVTILHEGKLAGIITRADLIKAYLHRFKPKDTNEDSAENNDGLRAKDVMRSGLLTVHKDTSIYEAMEIVATKNVTGLPVVDDSMNLLGIVSEKDMLRLLRESQVEPRTVQEYMTGDVISFNQESSLFEICDCLINNNFRRVPILNRGKLVGIISRTDIILYILKNKSTIFKYRRPS